MWNMSIFRVHIDVLLAGGPAIRKTFLRMRVLLTFGQRMVHFQRSGVKRCYARRFKHITTLASGIERSTSLLRSFDHRIVYINACLKVAERIVSWYQIPGDRPFGWLTSCQECLNEHMPTFSSGLPISDLMLEELMQTRQNLLGGAGMQKSESEESRAIVLGMVVS